MKLVSTVFLSLFLSVASLAANFEDSTVYCDLTVTDSDAASAPNWAALQSLIKQLRSLKYVKAVSTNSTTNILSLYFKDGSVEQLSPLKAIGKGIFGTQNFSGEISSRNGKVYVKSTKIGDVYMSHFCGLGDIPFERCVSQGDGDQANNALVTLNIEGQIINLRNIFGNDDDGYLDYTCSRTAK